MKKTSILLFGVLTLLLIFPACALPDYQPSIIFLHHSTGNNVWNGGVEDWFDDFNSSRGARFEISERAYPKSSPYGWDNYPYDYWNIWVNHAGPSQYLSEDTLELLTKDYNVIIWKHCYPVSRLNNPQGSGDITSSAKTIANYKLQYNALKAKMKQFPHVRFIVWTGAVHVDDHITEEQAQNFRTFVNWVKNEWDQPGDNIFLWDFYELETEGGLYLKDEYASNSGSDSHPNAAFCSRVAPLFCQRIVNVVQGMGDSTSLTGE